MKKILAKAKVATHGAGAPAHAPSAHTDQAAQQAALGAALTYAEQLVARWASKTVTITVDNATTLRNMSETRVEGEAASGDQPVAQTAAQAAADRLGAPPARQGPSGSKRRQREDEPRRRGQSRSMLHSSERTNRS